MKWLFLYLSLFVAGAMSESSESYWEIEDIPEGSRIEFERTLIRQHTDQDIQLGEIYSVNGYLSCLLRFHKKNPALMIPGKSLFKTGMIQVDPVGDLWIPLVDGRERLYIVCISVGTGSLSSLYSLLEPKGIRLYLQQD